MKHINILIFILLLTGCSNVELELEPFYPWVVNGYIDYDGDVEIEVSMSIENDVVVNTQNLFISNAHCKILENDSKKETELQPIGNGKYKANLTGIKDVSRFIVSLDHDEFGSALSDTIGFDSPNSIEDIKFVKTTTSVGNITRPSIRVNGLLKSFQSDAVLFIHAENSSALFQNTTYVDEQCENTGYFGYAIVSSDCFSRDEINFDINIRPGIVGGGIVRNTNFEIGIASADFLKYAQAFNQPEGFETGFLRPNFIYSNMKGSYGFIMAKKSEKYYLEF